MRTVDYTGILAIGDPHLSGRVPGFRKDDYPRVILNKLAWCLRYARQHSLLPIILGDLFEYPRENPNWLIGELASLFDPPVLALYGNHDCHQDQLTDDDSFSILVKAGRVRLLDENTPWRGRMNGREVILGGTSWGKALPGAFDAGGMPDGPPPSLAGVACDPCPPHGSQARPAKLDNLPDTFVSPSGQSKIQNPKSKISPLVFWMAHHDIRAPGYDDAAPPAPPIIGVDVVVNGHIHKGCDDVEAGGTLWITPGNIARRKRSEGDADRAPAVLRIDISDMTPAGWTRQMIEVPHQPYTEVFYDQVASGTADQPASAFISGLAELQARRTASGAGLLAFLEKNLGQFEPAVAAEILSLAQEVAPDA